MRSIYKIMQILPGAMSIKSFANILIFMQSRD